MNTLARYEYSETRVRELYRVQCPTLISTHEQGTIWLELYGPEQPVRAIMFHIKGHPDLDKARTNKSLSNLQYYNGDTGSTKMLVYDPLTVKDTKMFTLTKDHEPGFITMILAHPWFSRMEQRFILGGDEDTPSPWFSGAFQRVVPIPFMDHWTGPLWEAGIKNGMIKHLSREPSVWQIDSNTYKWKRMVERMIQNGVLHG